MHRHCDVKEVGVHAGFFPVEHRCEAACMEDGVVGKEVTVDQASGKRYILHFSCQVFCHVEKAARRLRSCLTQGFRNLEGSWNGEQVLTFSCFRNALRKLVKPSRQGSHFMCGCGKKFRGCAVHEGKDNPRGGVFLPQRISGPPTGVAKGRDHREALRNQPFYQVEFVCDLLRRLLGVASKDVNTLLSFDPGIEVRIPLMQEGINFPDPAQFELPAN